MGRAYAVSGGPFAYQQRTRKHDHASHLMSSNRCSSVQVKTRRRRSLPFHVKAEAFVDTSLVEGCGDMRHCPMSVKLQGKRFSWWASQSQASSDSRCCVFFLLCFLLFFNFFLRSFSVVDDSAKPHFDGHVAVCNDFFNVVVSIS